MFKLLCLLVIFGVLFTTCSGQWPLGPGFYRSMNQMTRNLNNMASDLRIMGERIARERDAKLADDMRRAQQGVPFENGGTVFITASGGLGYAYNSSDGSFTLYSLGHGSPPRGYMYHVGPYGTSYQNW
ncbi:uncharacterized protein LOC123546847 [Mercenaria mercenaria]|uniref:uncharacterized protein LOC123546847 n=1 Tax=Mercenaria mercenaria TaxID=6596 RepID=UPI00234E64BC|nr:uncharacterized protein LOC123546847 [Mercenaria mercenaria]